MNDNLRAAPAGTARFGSPEYGLYSGAAAAAPGEEGLPGAQADPCCMGSAAAEMLEVLTGYIDEELADRRYYLAFARQAPAWAREALRRLGEDEGGHARRLEAACYLITGRRYEPPEEGGRIYVGRLCPALRERYHAEACGGLNYLRSSEGTTDPCLAKLLSELSADEYRHAGTLAELLERALAGTCSGGGMGL